MLPYHYFDYYWQIVTPKRLRKDIENGANIHVKYKDNTTMLVNACRLTNNVEIIKILLQNGAEINPYSSISPLKMACLHSKNPEIILTLLEYGADPHDSIFRTLRSPLDCLLRNKHLVNTIAQTKLKEMGAKNQFLKGIKIRETFTVGVPKIYKYWQKHKS